MSTAPQISADEMDQFGRTEFDRTYVLSALHADYVATRAEDRDQSVDEALAYIIDRGIAEIKRTQQSQDKSKADRQFTKKSKAFTQLMKENPSLVTNQKFLEEQLALLAELANKAGKK